MYEWAGVAILACTHSQDIRKVRPYIVLYTYTVMFIHNAINFQDIDDHESRQYPLLTFNSYDLLRKIEKWFPFDSLGISIVLSSKQLPHQG